MSEKQQRLVFSIIDFLNQSIADGTVKADDREGLEVAIQCIGEAFNVDPSDKQQADNLSIKPTTLQSIFDVYLQTRNNAAAASSHQPPPKAPTPDHKAQADAHKQRGNSLMSAKKYDDAIQAYNDSVALDPTNPVYYSNRAAAYSSKGDHLAAVGDAEKAISIDPKFLKSYHRLGHAYWGLGDTDKSLEAYQRGLKQDPQNESLSKALRDAQDRIATSSEPTVSNPSPSTDPSPSLSDMASMLGGLGGGGGGLPDISGLMNNPQMRSMAQQMASNGGLASLMQNPGVQNMMNRIQNGNMPSMEELMSDPTLRNLANQFGAGAGRP
ncbi:Small glutamine-rich tetratricopeptide repeat-containing protein 2 [Termitomyces sp. J132]|nr:hypothetical protein H2248_000468 [Termitomyces sp. 'cryptogamus']KNZ79638.1 Small glutamine-rich tetratricopeptide repeat-containing protein 2 [Termitomyces sp. J132]